MSTAQRGLDFYGPSEASQGPCWKSNSVSATEALDGLPPLAATP